MNIGKVAQLTGLSIKQIRDYEKAGLINVAMRSEGNYRQYHHSEINRLNFIAKARAVGFSLAQIGELLALQDNPHRKSCEVKALTNQHIAELSAKIDTFMAMKNTLQQWSDDCVGDDGADCPILVGLGQN